MKSYRVSFVVSGMRLGGAERVVSMLANHWASIGWAVQIATIDTPKGEPSFFELHPDVHFETLDLAGSVSHWPRKTRLIGQMLKLRRAMLRWKSDVVIGVVDGASCQAIMAMLGSSTPVLAAEHTNPFIHQLTPKSDRRRRAMYPKAASVVCLLPRHVEFFPEDVRRRASVIPNPIVPVPRPAGASEDAERPKRVVALGRLAPEKAFHKLISAFASVADRHPDWTLDIWGEGPERPRLEALVEELGLAGRVRLPGATKDVYSVLYASDLFVLSSEYEGLPMALCEALASGLPVVSFDCETGPREILREGVDGLLIPAGDVEALGSTMNRLMSDDAERKRMAARAPEILERFGIDEVTRQWTSLFERVAKR